MPLLSREELINIADSAVDAAARCDQEGAIQALKPLWRPHGDAGDGWMLTSLLVSLVVENLPRPKCPKHGSDCMSLGFGLVRVDADGEPLWDDEGGVTPEIEQAYPVQVAFMRMLTAEFNDDLGTSLAVFCAMVKSGHAPELIWTAVQNAGRAHREKLARLQ